MPARLSAINLHQLWSVTMDFTTSYTDEEKEVFHAEFIFQAMWLFTVVNKEKKKVLNLSNFSRLLNKLFVLVLE